MNRSVIFVLLASIAVFAPACGDSTDSTGDAIDEFEEVVDDMFMELLEPHSDNPSWYEDQQPLFDRGLKIAKDLKSKKDDLTAEQTERVKRIDRRYRIAVSTRGTKQLGQYMVAKEMEKLREDAKRRMEKRKSELEGMNK